MALKEIEKALNGINQVIFKIGLTSVVIIMIIIAGFCIISKNQNDTLKYYIEKSYDYEYPNIENTNITGDDNILEGGDD